MAASGVQDISIHAPAKGATTISPSSDVMQSFQSTLPRRERPILDVQQPARHDFNPRSREGSDDYGDETSAVKFISIHAPAKGATYRLAARRKADRHFNPRSREGSDGGATVKYTRYCGISIHAPAKGATKRKPTADQQTDHFNPRSREGSDSAAASRLYA